MIDSPKKLIFAPNRPRLRNYQVAAKKGLYQGLKQRKNCLLYLPTGGGKTSVAADIITDVFQQGKKALFVAHRKELINQAHARLLEYGVSAGRIMGSHHKYQGDSINVASIQTLNNREFPAADVVIIDEAHHCVLEANGSLPPDEVTGVVPEGAKPSVFKKFFDHYNGRALIFGLSATPLRLDGKPLGNVFDDIILPYVDDEPVDVRWLQEQGYLVPAVYWGAPIKPDLDKVGRVKGDFDTKQLFDRLDKKTLYEGVVDNYVKHAEGKKAVCFCLNIQHSINTAEAFRAAGFAAGHLDGTMKPDDRDSILGQFKRGEILILCNVGILTEGYDLPNIEVVIGNRPTDSESLWLQMIGRALRPVWPKGFNEHESSPEERVAVIAASKKPVAIVLDQGENCQRLGFAETRREYSLDQPKNRRKGVSPIRECKEVDGGCGRIFDNLLQTACPDCGREYTAPEVLRTGPVRKEGGLVELKPEDAVIPARLVKPFRDMTLAELEEFRSLKRYALAWVVRQLQFRAEQQAKASGRPIEEVLGLIFTGYATLVTKTKKAYKLSWVQQQVDKIVTATYYED